MPIKHEPDRPDHDLPGRPGRHEPEPAPEPKREPTPEPKRERPAAREAAPKTAPPPTITGLLPTSACVGDPSFTLRVIGTGFDDQSVIIIAGVDEPTDLVTPTEVQTGMNMAVWLGADPAIPVSVRNADGQTSNTVDFAMGAAREVPLDPAHASKPIPSVDLI